jgi:hypothetical protein
MQQWKISSGGREKRKRPGINPEVNPLPSAGVLTEQF